MCLAFQLVRPEGPMPFMDLDSKALPLELWEALAKAAIAAGGKNAAKYDVSNKFYQRYENAGPDNSQSPPLLDAAAEAEMWKELASMYDSSGAGNLKTLLKDASQGKGQVQGIPTDRMARVYETYNNQALKGRFQFVVNFGGGTVLFNRMRRACQTALASRMKRNRTPATFCVQAWKVFGADAGQGRSDSCVVYLADTTGAPRVQDFIKDFLWPNISDIVADQFRPYGLCQIRPGTPVWGLDFPQKTKYQQVLAIDSQDVGNSYTSAGGMMGFYLGRGFELVDDSVWAKCQPSSGSQAQGRDELIAGAKANASEVLKSLA